MLTTKDNPYNPFDQFHLWWLYDIAMGYDSCKLLGRVVHLEEDMTEKEKEDAMDRAIDEIIANDPLGIFVRATESNPIPVVI